MKKIPVRLGEVAVHMGTITEEQLNEALEVQCFYDPPKLLGAILIPTLLFARLDNFSICHKLVTFRP